MSPAKDRHPNIFRERVPSPYRTDDGGKLLLRLALAIALLRFGHASEDPVKISMLVQYSLPGVLAYSLYPLQFMAPLLILLGWYSRIGALIAGLQYVVEAALFCTSVWTMSCIRGTPPLFALVVSAAIFLMGAGRYSLGGRDGRWN